MKVTIMQRDILWASKEENLRRAAAVMQRLAPCDLVVLPEMFATGFGANPADVAEPEDGGTVLQWMRQMARQHDCAVAGSVAVGATSFKNRLYFVYPDGAVAAYDKHHLFTYGGEHLNYDAGQQRVVVEWRGVRILLMVCYDLRFPTWSRNHEDYDCAIYVASWPAARIEAWTTLLRARAIENQCYVVGVNRVGDDPHCHYCGASRIIDAYGRDMAMCPRDEEAVATAELDITALNAFRSKFPVLKDRD